MKNVKIIKKFISKTPNSALFWNGALFVFLNVMLYINIEYFLIAMVGLSVCAIVHVLNFPIKNHSIWLWFTPIMWLLFLINVLFNSLMWVKTYMLFKIKNWSNRNK